MPDMYISFFMLIWAWSQKRHIDIQPSKKTYKHQKRHTQEPFKRDWRSNYRVAQMHEMPYLYRSFFSKKSSWLVTLLRKETYNLKHPTHLRHPVRVTRFERGPVWKARTLSHPTRLPLALALAHPTMGWLRSVGSIKLQVSFAEYCLLCRALLQKRPIILSILLSEART